jgi:hypothetical protein
MRKRPIDLDNLSDEQMCTEIIEITCDEMDSLTRAFQMLTRLCSDLEAEVEGQDIINIPEHTIH